MVKRCGAAVLLFLPLIGEIALPEKGRHEQQE
jgi:hypothetical protein